MSPGWCATPLYLLRDEWRASVPEPIRPGCGRRRWPRSGSWRSARHPIRESSPPTKWGTGCRPTPDCAASSAITPSPSIRRGRRGTSRGSSRRGRRRTAGAGGSRRWNVAYVLFSEYERALGGFDPSTRPWLAEVFATGDDPHRAVRVYAVRPALDRGGLNPSRPGRALRARRVGGRSVDLLDDVDSASAATRSRSGRRFRREVREGNSALQA